MKVVASCVFLFLWTLVNCTPSKKCNLENAIENTVMSVLSDAASSLISNMGKSNDKSPLTYSNLDNTMESYEGDKKKCPPKDCADIALEGQTTSGVYRIWPEGWKPCGMEVYCDLEKDLGGWTVIQRRGAYGRPNDYFYKRWRDYKFGFGNISEDFWLGNDKIHLLSNQDNYNLRVDMRTQEGESAYAHYDEFYIEPESKKYKLWIYGFQGDAGDSLSIHNGQFFGTNDRDNDNYERNCAVEYKGGWWYNKCHQSNLNGLYLNGQHESFANGINWKTWKGHHYSYPDVVIKIRPNSYRDQRKEVPAVPEPQ